MGSFNANWGLSIIQMCIVALILMSIIFGLGVLGHLDDLRLRKGGIDETLDRYVALCLPLMGLFAWLWVDCFYWIGSVQSSATPWQEGLSQLGKALVAFSLQFAAGRAGFVVAVIFMLAVMVIFMAIFIENALFILRLKKGRPVSFERGHAGASRLFDID